MKNLIVAIIFLSSRWSQRKITNSKHDNIDMVSGFFLPQGKNDTGGLVLKERGQLQLFQNYYLILSNIKVF
jgi:hypothetical protein